MTPPMYVGALSPGEQAGVEAGLRASNAFTLRRSQMLRASSRGQRPSETAQHLGCARHPVRNPLHAFEQSGLTCLKQESSRPKTIPAEFDQQKCEPCCTRVRAPLAKTRVSGRSPWPLKCARNSA